MPQVKVEVEEVKHGYLVRTIPNRRSTRKRTSAATVKAEEEAEADGSTAVKKEEQGGAAATISPPGRKRRATMAAKAEAEAEAEATSSTPSKQRAAGAAKGIAKGKGRATTTTSPKKTSGASPYPDYARPHPAECHRVRDALAELHGAPTREKLEACGTDLERPDKTKQSVLDSLVRTMLSQNTTDKTSARAFAKLKLTFPTWLEVLAAPNAEVEEAIREGGLAEVKTERIKIVLQTVIDERGQPNAAAGEDVSMEYCRNMPTDAVKAELARFKGVGPKTISCVLMFTLMRAEFPVDTHVWHIAKKMGWVPPAATRETTYLHLNERVPDDVKYDLHVLLVDHGKRCPRCAKKGRLQKEEQGPCPL